MNSKISYSKQSININAQIQLLKDRGLIITDYNKAKHILNNISYYRLSAYFYHYIKKPKENHFFYENTSFEDIFSLYCFDRELRKIIYNEIEKLEISFRTQIIYNFSIEKNPFWLEDSSLFHNNTRREEIMNKLKTDLIKSDETFIKAFYSKYSNDFPPAWISLEIVTFGQLSEIYKALNYSPERKNVALYYGLNERVFASWLHTLVYIRNLCAHHSRLWNRVLGVKPLNPDKTKNTWLLTVPRNDKVYIILSMLAYFLKIINPSSTYKNKLNSLFQKYPNINLKQMGFPDNWENEQLWK